MGCTFCASAMGGLERNLTTGEMADQILAIERDTGEKISHVAVMGTGEPLDNYDNLRTFIQVIHSKDGLNIGLRNITVSTCGLIPGIKQFAKDLKQVNLAVSLHGADDETRGRIMPVNRAWPVKDLLRACGEYTRETGRRVTFEYALIKGVNDAKEQIELLARELKGMLCHVNFIPLNQIPETGLKGSSRKHALEAAGYLEDRGIPATVRRELGADIDGACGQLRRGKI